MFCFRYKRLLIPYSEGVLGETERVGVEAHLSRCAGCRAELDAVRSVSGALRAVDAPAMEPATDLWAKVSARIETETVTPAPRPWMRVSQAASACAAAVLLAVVGIGMFGPNAPAPPPQNPPAVAQLPEKPVPGAGSPSVEKPRRTGKPTMEVAGVPETHPVLPEPSAMETRRTAPAEATRRIAVPAPALTGERFAAVRGIEAKPAPPKQPIVAMGREARETRGYAPSVGYARGDGKTDWDYRPAKKEVPLVLSRAAGRPEAGLKGLSVERVEGVDTDHAWDDKDGEHAARTSHFYVDGAAPSTNGPSESPRSLALASKPSEHFGVELADKLATASAPAAPAAAPSLTGGAATVNHVSAACGDTPTVGAALRTENAESVVDTLNKTEGVKVVALFAYP